MSSTFIRRLWLPPRQCLLATNLLITLVLLIGSPSIMAALPAAAVENTSRELEVISITGALQPTQANRLAGQVKVLSRQQIARLPVTNLKQLLSALGSLTLSQSGSIGGLTELRLRGGESNHTQVTVDGVALNDLGQGGGVDIAHLSIANIERIEIFYGGNSALLGQGAVSGVIAITTSQSSESNRVQVQHSLSDDATISANTQLAFGNADSQVNLFAERVLSDGVNTSVDSRHTGIGTGERDGYQRTVFGINLTHEIAERNKLTVSSGQTRFVNPFDGLSAETGLPTDSDDYTRGQRSRLTMRYDIEGDSLEQQLGLRHINNEANNFSNMMSNGSTDTATTSVYYQQLWNFSGGNIGYGVEHSHLRFSQRAPITFADPNQDQTNNINSIYGDLAWQMGDATLSVNARHDANQIFANALSYRTGINWTVDRAISIYASHSTAVKNPTFTERFGYFPDTFIGNPSLEPERAKKYEVGAHYRKKNNQIKIALFKTKLKDEINGFFFDAESGNFTAINVGTDSQRSGFEVDINTRVEQLEAGVNYQYLDASENGVSELRRANHIANMYLTQNSASGWYHSLLLNYQGERVDLFFPPFPESAQRVTLSDMLKVNLKIEKRFADSRLYLQVTDLFDRQTQEIFGYNVLGRQVTIGTSVTF